MCFSPSCKCTYSNDRADSADKSVLTLPLPVAGTRKKIRINEFIYRVPLFCQKQCQDVWNGSEGVNLHAIYPKVGEIAGCKTCPGLMQ